MIRSAVIAVVAGLVVLTACKKDDDTSTSDSVDGTSNRSVVCGKASCTNDDFCCGSPGFGDANCSVVCTSPQGSMYCDDATDCATGQVCCYFSTSAGISGSSCLTTCPTSDGHGQLCKSGSTECPGTTCKGLGIAPAGLSSCQ